MRYTIDGHGGYREVDTTDNLHQVDASYFESAAKQLGLPSGDYQAEWHESNGTRHRMDFIIKLSNTTRFRVLYNGQIIDKIFASDFEKAIIIFKCDYSKRKGAKLIGDNGDDAGNLFAEI